MSKYKSLTDPITRHEACFILDKKRFDGAVRAGSIAPIGKLGAEGVIDPDAPLTAPLLFDQEAVRAMSVKVADELLEEAKQLAANAKELAKSSPPLTRRQIAELLGKRLTGILIRSGSLTPDGSLTDTQTAAHTYSPIDVSAVASDLATERKAEGQLIKAASKTRIFA